MSGFEYFTALVSIVLGFTLARVVGGIGNTLIDSKRGVEVWLTTAWCVALLIQILVFWFVIWRIFSASDSISFVETTVFVLATVVLYLASYVLVSNDHDRIGIPISSFFFCLAIHFSLVVGYTSVVSSFSLGTVISGGLICLSLTGPLLKKNSHHFVLVSVYLITLIAVTLTTVQTIGDGSLLLQRYE